MKGHLLNSQLMSLLAFQEKQRNNLKIPSNYSKKLNFNNVYIVQYSPRPGTVAFSLKDDIPLKEKNGEKNFGRINSK